MKSVFNRHLEMWAKERPVHALQVQAVNAKNYRRLASPQGSNLKMPWGKLYSDHPLLEAENWFSSLRLEGIKLLYVYGVGLGYYYEVLKKWLKEDEERHVVFLEDDLAVLKRFFEEPHAEVLLTHNQVTVCYLHDIEDKHGVLETLYWSFVLTPFLFTSLRSYELEKPKQYEAFRYKISYSTTMKNALVEEYLRYGVGFFRNFYRNILELDTSYWGNALFGQFPGIPAVICGAGPSLEQQLPLLKYLKNKALVFAGGSSLNAVSAHGILPHFGAGIDPNPTQYLRLTASEAFEVPFFYRSRMQHDAFRKIPGFRLYISGAGGYDVAEWYEKTFNLEAEFLDEGHNVVNFCTEIATRLGCNPIIYIGMDLAFTGMKAYSRGNEEQVEVC